MASGLELKVLVEHLVNGTLGDNLCIICLEQLSESYENIFTKVCKEDREYCIADVLEKVCQIKFDDETANFNVCFKCFVNASLSYKFFLLSKTSEEILNYCTDQISQNIDLHRKDDVTNNVFISLPSYIPKTFNFNFDFDGIGSSNNSESPIQQEQKTVKNEDDVVVIVQDNGASSFYKVLENGGLIALNETEQQNYNAMLPKSAPTGKKNQRKKRGPMAYKSCSLCPVKYRFVAKLQNHMKTQHNVNLYVCKVCKAITEDELEYHNHLKTHTNIHQCAHCNTVFKKRDTIIEHLKWHEKMKNIGQSESAHVCEVCGVVLEDEQSLADHWESRHYKKFTCYYCGRMYKGENSFEMHIKKHEEHLERQAKKPTTETAKSKAIEKPSKEEVSKPRCTCNICGRSFVDQRSLLWHQRLHNNERPYSCDVHLKAHKRRNRTSKYQNVFWRTEPVPIQELSVSIQNEILEMQAAKGSDHDDWLSPPVSKIETMDCMQ